MKLANLTYTSCGDVEAVIHRELSALYIQTHHPPLNDDGNSSFAARHVLDQLPQRSFGRIQGDNGSIWLFRYDESYTIVCEAPVLQNKLDALVLLSDNDISVSEPAKYDANWPLLLKLSSQESLTLAVIVLRQALNATITAAI